MMGLRMGLRKGVVVKRFMVRLCWEVGNILVMIFFVFVRGDELIVLVKKCMIINVVGLFVLVVLVLKVVSLLYVMMKSICCLKILFNGVYKRGLIVNFNMKSEILSVVIFWLILNLVMIFLILFVYVDEMRVMVSVVNVMVNVMNYFWN